MKYMVMLFVFLLNSAWAVQKTNPDIGVGLLLIGKKSLSGESDHEEDHHEEDHNHHIEDVFFVQEIEMSFKSNIDPYWSGSVFLGVAQHENHFELELEEAFIESLFIPNSTIKVGKFFANLGRHNHLHIHAYPFIDPPLINESLFGFHGLNETGISIAYLSPLPWYSELIAQSFYSEKWSGVLFFKNLWELSDNSTLEINMSYGTKIKDFKHLYNLALVWKWQALKNPYSLTWTTEALQAVENPQSEDIGGVNSYIQWQFSKRWWLEGRSEYLSHAQLNDIQIQKHSFLVAFVPTEYSSIRLQYNIMQDDHKEWGQGIAVQASMNLGTHPAHLY